MDPFSLHLLGQVYSLGRAEYGRLGLGKGVEEKSEPTPVSGIELACGVACGASVSYAVTREGEKQSKNNRGLLYCFFKTGYVLLAYMNCNTTAFV